MDSSHSQLRLDPLSGRWVVVSTNRAERPFVFPLPGTPVLDDASRPCPFCPGNEEATAPALETYGPSGRWLVRVVPNLYPAFEGDEPFVVANRGPVFTQATAGGIHEVLILSPEHDTSWGMLSDEQADWAKRITLNKTSAIMPLGVKFGKVIKKLDELFSA